MITIAGVQKRAIQRHYDLSTVFYRLLWGPHIHHGLWNGDESPAIAQRQLIDTLAERAGLKSGEHVLDVGCGMGGSSIHLAKKWDCQVTGMTLSPVQRLWARASSSLQGMRWRTNFLRQDAEEADFRPQSFDVLWSIECTEHLFDKPAFFQRAQAWLRPGGRVAICAWLSGNGELNAQQQDQVRDVCRGMLCPSLGSQADYTRWFEAAGLRVTHCEDWTDRVIRTWEICRARIERFRVRAWSHWIDRDSHEFLDRFQSMLDAYASGAMRYGCLVAEKNPVS